MRYRNYNIVIVRVIDRSLTLDKGAATSIIRLLRYWILIERVVSHLLMIILHAETTGRLVD